jgi:lipoate-protein ligase A
MAGDEALLESAMAGSATLRFYGWSAPTLSLGYFQEANVCRANPVLEALPWVRRPSGGAALVHHHEVTYALALPAGPPWQNRGACECWPARMHGVLQAALAALGVATRPCVADQERKLDHVLCFLHHTTGDLLAGPSKVVGSAQRRRRGALLQHGSILLAASPHAPMLFGLAEWTGRPIDPLALVEAATKEFKRSTGWAVELNDWTEREKHGAADLAQQRYRAAAWNARR